MKNKMSRSDFTLWRKMRQIAFPTFLSIVCGFFLMVYPALAQQPVVRAILYFSPTCPHCHEVMTEDLPPLIDHYQDQLILLVVDTTTPGGSELFQASMEFFEVPQNQYYVPALVVGDTLLVGSADIPGQFPGIVEEGLSTGGIDWPAIPGLAEAVSSLEEQLERRPEVEATATLETEATHEGIEQVQPTLAPTILPEVDLSLMDRINQDPVGNGTSILVLLGMMAVVLTLAIYWFNHPERLPIDVPTWIIPLLSVIGMAVAGYLTYIESTQVEAVCGPVGDCNTVNQSEYARLFGILPVGLLGLVGYILILMVSVFGQQDWGRASNLAQLILFALAAFGTLFSIYLTALEPFVIGATCAWCLASAMIITAQMWFSSGEGRKALIRLRS
jgi:uncharacterized membrane protein